MFISHVHIVYLYYYLPTLNTYTVLLISLKATFMTMSTFIIDQITNTL